MMAATTTMPSASTNTGSVVDDPRLPQDSTTSPGCSATHAAPAARQRDQQQKQNDPDHRIPYCAGLASTAMASAAN